MAAKTKPKRGVIYGRQSRTRQGSESLDVQVEACRATAKQHGVEIVETLLEPPSTSAYKNRGRNRPQFPALLALIESGDVDCVIAYKTDRLSRGGGPGWAPLIEAAERAGLDLDRFVLVAGNGFMSEFEIGIRATMDREESRKTSERLTDVALRRAGNGLPSGGGARAYGYERDGTTVVESEAAVIREVLDRFIAGEGLKAIARDLNDRGIVTAKGRQWRDATLRNMLVSPRIAGLRVHRGEVIGEAAWPAIVERARWEAFIAQWKARAGVRPATKYLLSGIAKCDVCNYPMQGAVVDGSYKYKCIRKVGTGACGGMTMHGPTADDEVIGAVLQPLNDSRALPAARRRKPAADDPASTIVALDSQLASLAAQYGNGDISQAEWSAARKPLLARLESAHRALDKQAGESVLASLPKGTTFDVAWFMAEPLWRRRALVDALLDVSIARATKRGLNRPDPDRVVVLYRN